MTSLSIMPRTRLPRGRHRERLCRNFHLCFEMADSHGPIFCKARGSLFCGTDRRVIHLHTMMERPLAKFDLERAIALRWALRDILGNRLKLSPVRDNDLRTLIDLGFVEIRDDTPVVTEAGLAALE